MVNEEISGQMIGLMFRGTRMTSSMLKSALRALLRGASGTVKKIASSSKGSMKSFADDGMLTSDIEITRDNIGDFDHFARKYGVKYTLKEIKDPEHPDKESRFLVIFKAKDAATMMKAFKEYCGYILNKDGKEESKEEKRDKRNVDEKVRDAKEKAKERKGKTRERTRSQDRSSTTR